MGRHSMVNDSGGIYGKTQEFWIIANYLWILFCFGLFVDYLKHGLFEIIYLWIICGLFETWII